MEINEDFYEPIAKLPDKTKVREKYNLKDHCIKIKRRAFIKLAYGGVSRVLL